MYCRITRNLRFKNKHNHQRVTSTGVHLVRLWTYHPAATTAFREARNPEFVPRFHYIEEPCLLETPYHYQAIGGLRHFGLCVWGDLRSQPTVFRPFTMQFFPLSLPGYMAPVRSVAPGSLEKLCIDSAAFSNKVSVPARLVEWLFRCAYP